MFALDVNEVREFLPEETFQTLLTGMVAAANGVCRKANFLRMQQVDKTHYVVYGRTLDGVERFLAAAAGGVETGGRRRT